MNRQFHRAVGVIVLASQVFFFKKKKKTKKMQWKITQTDEEIENSSRTFIRVVCDKGLPVPDALHCILRGNSHNILKPSASAYCAEAANPSLSSAFSDCPSLTRSD